MATAESNGLAAANDQPAIVLKKIAVNFIVRCKQNACGICFDKSIRAACYMDFGNVQLQIAFVIVGGVL